MQQNAADQQFAVMRRFMEQNQGAELLCFGESFLQGFDGLTWDYAIDRERAISLEGPEMQAIRQLARDFRCGLSFGFIEACEEALYSSNIVLDAQGKILDLFRRVSVGWKEHSITGPQYREGPAFHAFDLYGVRAVTAICGDLWYEQNLAALQALAPQMVLWPLYVDYGIPQWEAEERAAYASQVSPLGCPVLMINSFVDDPQQANGGCVAFYAGQVLAELPMGCLGQLQFDLYELVEDPFHCSFGIYPLEPAEL